jgi:hypothetical protein
VQITFVVPPGAGRGDWFFEIEIAIGNEIDFFILYFFDFDFDFDPDPDFDLDWPNRCEVT